MPKVPVHPLLHVATLLRGDNHDFVAVESSHSANNGGVVAKATVSMNFAQVGKDALDVVEGLRALRMPRQFRLVPGSGRSVHLFAKGFDALAQRGDLALRGIVGARGFHLGHLTLDLFHFLLNFFGGCHA